MLADTLGEEDRELQQHLAPILDTPRPFARDVHGDQIQHFQQRLVGREDALALRCERQ